MNEVLAIDQGNESSGWVFYDSENSVKVCGISPNIELLDEILPRLSPDYVAIEQIRSYGMSIGATTMDSIHWAGRFHEKSRSMGAPVYLVPRLQVKLHLCQSPRAKDTNVRQALLDRFGGDIKTCKGTQKKPGPLYGVKSHIWSALAIAITVMESKDVRRKSLQSD